MTIPAQIQLSAELTAYIEHGPNKDERRERGIDGSQMELKIFTALDRQGLTKEEIVSFCDEHALPRHEEDKRKDGNVSATLSRIKQACESNQIYLLSLDKEGLSAPTGGSPPNKTHSLHVTDNEHNRQKRVYCSSWLAVKVLQIVDDAESDGRTLILSRWYDGMVACSEQLAGETVSHSTARRYARLLLDKGYAQQRKLDGKSYAVTLTERGRTAIRPSSSAFGRLLWLWAASESVPQAPSLDVPEGSEDVPTECRPSGAKRVPKPKLRSKKKSITSRIDGYRSKHLVNDHEVDPDFVEFGWRSSASSVPWGTLGVLTPSK